MTTLCTGTNKAGQPCRWHPWKGRTLCLNCAVRAGDPEALEEIRRRSKVGRARVQARSLAAAPKSCPLRTTEDRLSALERSALLLLRSKEGASTRARAMASLVHEARETVKGDQERTAEMINELLERYPELGRRVQEQLS
jgi:hypothetical protein